jgi:hypothetical protein
MGTPTTVNFDALRLGPGRDNAPEWIQWLNNDRTAVS